MRNLCIYICIFVLVICVMCGITTYFYSNIEEIDKELFISSEYTKLNLYFLKTIKTDRIKIKKYGLTQDDDYYITFENSDGSKNTFVKLKNIIYFNNIKLCKNVEEFKVIVDKTDKESISVDVKISGKVYNLQYVIN